MSIRFRKSFKVAPGVRLNVSKSGLGMSVGTRGARVGVGPRGAYTSVGIPGTGIYSINYLGGKKSKESNQTMSSFSSDDIIPVPAELRQGSSVGCLAIIVGLIFSFTVPPLGVVILFGTLIISVANSNAKAIRLHKKANRYVKKGKYSEAVQQLEKVLQLKPTLNITKLNLAKLYVELEDYQKAIQWYEDYLEKDNNEIARFNLALCYSETGQKEKALDVLQSLSSVYKKELLYIIALAKLFLDMNKPNLALEILQTGPIRKQNMDDQMMVYRYLLGISYMKLGEKKKAITQLQKVYVYNRNFQDVTNLLNELGALKESKEEL